MTARIVPIRNPMATDAPVVGLSRDEEAALDALRQLRKAGQRPPGMTEWVNRPRKPGLWQRIASHFPKGAGL